MRADRALAALPRITRGFRRRRAETNLSQFAVRGNARSAADSNRCYDEGHVRGRWARHGEGTFDDARILKSAAYASKTAPARKKTARVIQMARRKLAKQIAQ